MTSLISSIANDLNTLSTNEELMMSLSPLELSEILDTLPLVEKFVNFVREFSVKTALEKGKIPDGYAIELNDFGHERWKNEVDAINTLNRHINGNFMRECFTSPNLKEPSDVRSILGEANEKLIDSLVIVTTNVPQLVKESLPKTLPNHQH